MEEEGSKTMVKGGVETTMRVGSKYERGLGERVQWQRATRFKPTRRHQMIRVKKKKALDSTQDNILERA